MTHDGVALRVDGPVATVTLDRPEVLNAQTTGMWARLREVARDLAGDVRVVVVRGAGRAFSSGLDLRRLDGPTGLLAELTAGGPAACAERIAEFQQAFSWLRRPDLVSIAAVRGPAVGAGFQLALQCDLRILAADAVLAMSEVTHGLVPDLGGIRPLVDLVGHGRAAELCLTGRHVDAAEAARLGLATLVVPPDTLEAATDDLVAAVLAADRDAAAEIKALVAGATVRDPEAQLRAEREAQTRRLFRLAGRGD
ncbi:enoyl-CoA hydratase [Pilimelia terevasa]|uniref:Enoyl-CoA hydratase n=1 Tax=Pilimelia terevasa TaxID=53372 RepID=A0A8J3BM10_9ACTN|nr:enoyl-CoA hydratase/isomerase family protein [Pilimelia terevasa]GGK24111.1 enoyl-CoA hydratase [Pilimelia terevasa]